MVLPGLIEIPSNLVDTSRTGNVAYANVLADAYLAERPDISSQKLLLTVASYGGSAGHAGVMRACHAHGLRSDPADVMDSCTCRCCGSSRG
jgi:hypothetical protein